MPIASSLAVARSGMTSPMSLSRTNVAANAYVVAASTYAFAATFVLLKLIGLVMPLRATASEEAIGMDIIAHGEEAYATGDGAILVALGDKPIRGSALEVGSDREHTPMRV